MSSAKLSIRQKLGFGVCDLGGNLFFTAMGFWTLNYLTDTVALSAAAAGFAIMVGKFWDAVTDPMMGYISDRTKSRMGRRRPYILFGSIPLGIAMWYFFTNPHIDSQLSLTVWAVIALCALNTAYTIVNIPYSALTPELTQDYHERTTLNSFRFGFAVVGTILGAAIVLPIVNAFPDKSSGYSAAGLVMGVVMVVTALITFFSVREPAHNQGEIPNEGIIKTYAAVFRNKPYTILIATYAMNIIAINFLQGILVYYFKYVFNAESETTVAMVILLVVAMLCIPLSVPISKRIGKRLTYQIGLGIIAVGCFIIWIAGDRLGLGFVYAMMVFAGTGFGLTYVAPWAMVPDTIEWDAVHTGNRKEGIYYGMWTFFSKCGQALSIGVSGLVLSFSGYIADAVQSKSSLTAIKLLIGPVPALVFVCGILILSKYPITEKVYTEMMKKKNQTRLFQN
ncbi:MAG: putative symporter YjmB [Spirochaetes bacterium ADurb.Bin269]|nr:MAG: putative symporter YjmB [Spirochaetes bacterium ADurb.Bin269]